MRDVQRGDGADGVGVFGKHAVGEGTGAGVARVDHEEKCGAGLHQAPIGVSRRDVAPQMDDRLPAQMLQAVPLVVGRGHRDDLGGPPVSVGSWRAAEERASVRVPGVTDQHLQLLLGDDAGPHREGLFPHVRAGEIRLADDVVRGGALTWSAGQPHANVTSQHGQVPSDSVGRRLEAHVSRLSSRRHSTGS